jgi:signal transduction histidine kinase
MSYSSTLDHAGPSAEVAQLFACVSTPPARTMPIQKEATDFRSVVKQAIADSLRLILKRAHELLVSLPEEPLPVHADPSKLESVVLHLLDNSAKYTPDGGCIWVQLARENDEAVLRVRDSGNGISAELLRCVFEFVPPAGLGAAKNGFGIGLAIAKGLVALHGGTIMARSDGIGLGSDFTVRLPVFSGEPASVLAMQ